MQEVLTASCLPTPLRHHFGADNKPLTKTSRSVKGSKISKRVKKGSQREMSIVPALAEVAESVADEDGHDQGIGCSMHGTPLPQAMPDPSSEAMVQPERTQKDWSTMYVHESEKQMVLLFRGLLHDKMYSATPGPQEIALQIAQMQVRISCTISKYLGKGPPRRIRLETAAVEDLPLGLLFGKKDTTRENVLDKLRAWLTGYSISAETLLTVLMGIAVHQWIFEDFVEIEFSRNPFDGADIFWQHYPELHARLSETTKLQQLRDTDPAQWTTRAASLSRRLMEILLSFCGTSAASSDLEATTFRFQSLQTGIKAMFEQAFRLRLTLAMSRFTYSYEIIRISSTFDPQRMQRADEEEAVSSHTRNDSNPLVSACILPAIYSLDNERPPNKCLVSKAIVKTCKKR